MIKRFPPTAEELPSRFWRTTLAAAAGWTVLVALAMTWSFMEYRYTAFEEARLEALIGLEKDNLLRLWMTAVDGIYVPEKNQSQPGLRRVHGQEPVVETTSGQRLVRVNSMTVIRQLMELGREQHGLRGHLTSLKPLRPENAPDAWEAAALRTFEQGETETSSIENLEGRPYMRVIRPIVTEDSCVACHGKDRPAGSIRGGISVSVPMAPVWAATRHQLHLEAAALGLIWLLGLAALGYGARRMHQRKVERIRDRMVLRESEERYRLLFKSNPLSMWVYERETLRFLAVNESAVHHYGYTREEFLAMTIRDIRPVEDMPLLARFIDEDQPAALSTSEWRHRRKDGTIIRVEIISRPLTFEGRAARLVVAIDITEKKLLEQKFLHAQRLESIGMLAAGIAHDLNNVLAPIVFTTPLLRKSLSAPRDLKILDTLERSAGRGAGLVRQILGFAHSTADEFQPVQVKHLARDILSVVEETFPKSIRLESYIPSDLWPVQGNATQIHQVLMNLCVNARDAMPQGGRLLLTASNRRLDAASAAAIKGARPGAWLLLEVGDTGTGITPEVLERIWTPFFTTKVAGKGTGLGLSTVRSIVLNHHGFVELDTKAGHGSTFRVFLPAIDAEPARAKSASPYRIPYGRGETILVVDDDAAIRDMICQTLETHGYRFVSCADGVEAITLFSTNPRGIPLVITDVDMPRLGGVGLAQALLPVYPDLRFLAISGLSLDDTGLSDLPVARKLAHAFLLKPFTPEDLLTAVDRLLHPAEKP